MRDLFEGPMHRLRGAAWWMLPAALATGCGEPDPYTPFILDPAEVEIGVSESWRTVLEESAVDPGQAEPWQEPLVRDILQLGPWPPQTDMERAALDSAWAGFTQFPGTKLGIHGIDSMLAATGILTAAGKDLQDAFGRFSRHFEETPLPHIDLGYTGFNYSAYPTADILLVGCEFFLGGDHPAVKGLPPHIYPGYMQERMVPEHLIGDALRGWLLVHFQQDYYPSGGRLADELLYWGKVLFIARCIDPERPPQHLFDWTEAEWNWIRDHELQIWMELRKEEFLYTTKRMDIQRWVADAPFTKAGAVPQESPDRLGWYMGLRWVEDYMRRHPEMTLSRLMEQKDVLPFLQAYRPRG